jgi:hypothetical protein
MSTPRRHLNATVLPDGTVLVTGGISGGGELNNVSTGVHQAEVGPGHQRGPRWRATRSRAPTLVSLMVDGTVLSGASGDAFIPGTTTQHPAQRNHEIFRPPYLFKGARPTIASRRTGHGATFTVTTANAAQTRRCAGSASRSPTRSTNARATGSTSATASGVQAGAIQPQPDAARHHVPTSSTATRAVQRAHHPDPVAAQRTRGISVPPAVPRARITAAPG